MREDIEELHDEFEELFERYKPRFGCTFSFFDVSRSEVFMERAIALMKQALAGERGAVTNADIGFNRPHGVVT